MGQSRLTVAPDGSSCWKLYLIWLHAALTCV